MWNHLNQKQHVSLIVSLRSEYFRALLQQPSATLPASPNVSQQEARLERCDRYQGFHFLYGKQSMVNKALLHKIHSKSLKAASPIAETEN